MNKTAFKKELEHLINRHSMENGSDTPDWILAEYLCDCLEAFNSTIRDREWYYRLPKPYMNEQCPCEETSLTSVSDKRIL